MAFYGVSVHRLLLFALIIGQTKAQRASPFVWTAPVDLGAPCTSDAGVSFPVFCSRPVGNIIQLCIDDRPELASRQHEELCNDHCTCQFGATCVRDSSMLFCQKRCYAQSDCARGQFCHRFWNSEVSACLGPGFGWLRRSDWKPDERKYWSPTYRWLEPYRYEPPSPAQRVKEAADDERRRRLLPTR